MSPSHKSYTNSKCYNQSEALNELSNYKLPVLVSFRFGISIIWDFSPSLLPTYANSSNQRAKLASH